MKRSSKIILGLMMVLLLAAAGLFISAQIEKFMQDDKAVTDRDLSTAITQNDRLAAPFSGFSRLTADEQKSYLRLTKEIEAHNGVVEMGDNTINVDGLARVWTAINQDNPQFFWLSNYSYHYNEETFNVNQVDLNFLYDQEEVEKRQLEMDAAVNALKALITAEMDDYTKVKTIHDSIIKSTEYDLNAADNQNICSVFIGKRSVCAGYSKAMQYILNDLGISCTYVSGEAAGRGPHAWNLVQMEGDVYYIDTTWDDPSFVNTTEKNPNNVDYAFFGITTEELLKTHIIDGSLGSYPMASAAENNYFVRENYLFNLNSNGEKQRFITALNEAILKKEPQLCVKFTAEGMIDQALNIIEHSDILPNTSIRYRREDTNQILTFLLTEEM